jgi:hypothetical protein
MAEVLFNSPIGILSLVTVLGALAIIIGWALIWAYKIKHKE